MKFLNFGSLNIDISMNVDEIARPGETISSSFVKKSPGGKGLNQSVALSKVLDRVYQAGAIGPDGKFLIDFLEAEGVDTSLIKTVDTLTGNALIQVDKRGENSIILYKGANFKNGRAYIDRVLEKFSKGDVLILQNEIDGLSYIIDRAFDKGMKVALNPSPITSEIGKIDHKKVDLFLVNEHEAASLAGSFDLTAIKKYFKDNKMKVVLTLGRRGSVFIGDGREVFQKSYEVETLDTTGAGDTFAGFFIGAYYKNKPLEEALDLAARASAIAVTKKGAASSIPSMGEIKKFS